MGEHAREGDRGSEVAWAKATVGDLSSFVAVTTTGERR